jgi:hypothetical protein
MSMARLVITAVTIRGRSKRRLAVGLEAVNEVLHPDPGYSVLPRHLTLGTSVPPPSFQSVRGRSGGGGPDRAAA